MGTAYLLTRNEIEAAARILEGREGRQEPAEVRSGFGEEKDRSAEAWGGSGEEALGSLMRKEYLLMDGGTFLMDPILELFVHLIRHPSSRCNYEDGTLYSNGEVWLWVMEDPRKLSGLLLYPYEGWEEWRQDWGDGRLAK